MLATAAPASAARKRLVRVIMYAIWYAAQLCPAMPIRAGSTKPRLTIESIAGMMHPKALSPG